MTTDVAPSTAALERATLLATLSAADREHLAPYLRLAPFAAGDVIIQQGTDDRDLFLIVEGRARLRRHGLDLGHLGPGQYFGELALLDPHPRAATVWAETPVTCAVLSPSRLDTLAVAHPDLAFRLTRAFVTTIGERLRAMTDEVGHLLHERSLPRRTQVTLTLDAGPVTVPTGTPIHALIPERVDGRLVVAALLDRRAVSLATPLSSDSLLQPLTTAHWEGRGVLRQSASLLLLEALHLEGADARMGPMTGVAQRVLLRGGDTPDLLERVVARMQALVDEDRPLREEFWTADEAVSWFQQQGRTEVADLLSTRREATVSMVSYGELHVLGLVPLVYRSGLLGGCRILRSDGDLLLVHAAEAASGEGSPTDEDVARAQANSEETLAAKAADAHHHTRWQGALGIRSVGEFNRACIDGRVQELVRVIEGSQEKRIGRIADDIAARCDEVRVVCIAGPSSSGKTTFLERLRVQLQVEGVQPVGIELDQYFHDRAHTPRDAAGDYDFEAFETLRSDLLAAHLRRLFAGETVRTARFDFATGTSHAEGGRTLTLAPDQVLLLEGIHGLNPRLLGDLPPERAYRVFIGPVAQLPFDDLTRVHGSDVRLLRRIVRDRHRRGSDAAQTVRRWPSVRRGERLHIFPFLAHAHVVFDTSLVYELSVLKVFAERYLLEVPRSDPAYATAYRLLRLLDQFVTMYPDQVPPTSLLREFIGGSGFDP